MSELAADVIATGEAETAVRVAAERIAAANGLGPMPTPLAGAGGMQRVLGAVTLAAYLESIADAEDAAHNAA